MKETIKNIATFLKENSTVLILIPTTIGSIVQIYNLYVIDPYLIRFFSITQLISDGLWILLIFTPLYFLVPLAIMFLRKRKESRFSNNDEKKSGIGFVNFFVVFAYIVFTYYVISRNMFWLLWMLILSSLMAISLNTDAANAFKKNRAKYLNWIAFFYIGLFASTIGFIYTLTQNKSMPKSIGNLQVFKDKMMNTYPNHKLSIVYMNDKYLFSKVYCDSINELNTKIIISPIEDLFKFKEN